MASMKDCIFITLMVFLLISCGGGGGARNGDPQQEPGDEAGSMLPIFLPEQDPPAEDTPVDEPSGDDRSTEVQLADEPPVDDSPSDPLPRGAPPVSPPPDEHMDPESLGFWASFSQDHFRVEETMLTDDSSTWSVHGTPTGLVDNLPRNTELPSVFRYSGHVWGRVSGGKSSLQDETNRVVGQMRASYGSRDHYGPGADDVLNIFLSHMWGELPDGHRYFLPGMIFRGDVGTNRTDPDYDPLQDTATFTLSPEQYKGNEKGKAAGSFYGPNGEAVAGTFWYSRDGYRIEGAFGGALGE